MKTQRVVVLVLMCVFGHVGCSDAFEAGFNRDEAGQMLELCINLNGDGMATNGIPPDSTSPADWEMRYDSAQNPGPDADKDKGFGPYHNRWKLWQSKSHPNEYAIVIRGTIANADSIKQDLIATSLSATQTTIVGGLGSKERGVRFRLAETPKAEVHAGFTFGVAVLMFNKERGILNQLKQLVPEGSDVYITGHSQGAALATLAHSFLYYAKEEKTFGMGEKKYQLKSYVFAQPKPGNWQYAMDFSQYIGKAGMSYVINNTHDVVPQVPLSIQLVSETIRPFANNRGVWDYVVGALEWMRESIAKGFARLFSTADHVASDFDPAYCMTEGELKTSGGNSLDYMPVGNVMAVRSKGGDAPLPKDDMLREHHLGLYKQLLGQL
jgi:hypothetical protein